MSFWATPRHWALVGVREKFCTEEKYPHNQPPVSEMVMNMINICFTHRVLKTA